MRRRNYWIFGATVLMVGAAGACKKAPPPAPAPTAAEPAPAPPAPPVAVAGVSLGRAIDAAKGVAAPMTTFGVRDTVYASVATTGVSPAATLSAKWTFQTGQLVDSTSQKIAPTGPATTEFHISKKSAWPAGKYTVAITLDGGAPMVKEFEIKK